MKTYNDLVKVGAKRGEFCRTAVNEFMASRDYKEAQDGEAYYNKHNLTIEGYQKMLYTVSGREVKDIFSANYKLKTLFFRRLITQQVQYVLGNGVILSDVEKKAQLGADFDFKMQMLAKKAMAQGRAFGFWNLDHLEVFGYADTPNGAGFCPLYDEKTSNLEAGIRYWFRQVGDKRIFRATLYEADGYTEYRQLNEEAVEVLEEKRAYKLTKAKTGNEVQVIEKENYNALPIIELYANDAHESELIGIRESIDCYDFIKSGLANDIDDTSGFYWVLKNTGGMDDTDLAQFVQRMKTVKATVINSYGDESATAEAHTLDVPHEARSAMLELLRKDIYEDFQALDVNTLSASAKTTQEIQASYQAQDNKCADFEYYLIDFVQHILNLAGIEADVSFNWNRVVNQAEITNMILQASNFLTEEMVIKKLPFLTTEEAEEVIQNRSIEDINQFSDDDNTDEE